MHYEYWILTCLNILLFAILPSFLIFIEERFFGSKRVRRGVDFCISYYRDAGLFNKILIQGLLVLVWILAWISLNALLYRFK